MKDRKPIHELRLGTLRAMIWDNGGDDSESQFRICVSRISKGKNAWKETHMLSPDDLPVAAAAMEMCYSWLWRREIIRQDAKATEKSARPASKRSR